MSRHGDKIRETGLSKTGAATSPVAASRSRSFLVHGLDPDHAPKPDRVDDVACAQARERLGRLVAIAGPATSKR